MTKPNQDAKRRYRIWVSTLRAMCQAYERLERQIGSAGEAQARSGFRTLAKQVDVYSVPQPWKSWEHLGDAIHGGPHRQKAW